jgi:hypothetical protein
MRVFAATAFSRMSSARRISRSSRRRFFASSSTGTSVAKTFSASRPGPQTTKTRKIALAHVVSWSESSLAVLSRQSRAMLMTKMTMPPMSA